MKTLVGTSAKAEFHRFVRNPYSTLGALRSLRNATDTALLSLLIEKCFEFDKGFIDLTYAKISKLLKRGTRAIAESSKRLRKLGMVMTERLFDGSYRWRVPLDSDEVKSDPEGRYVVRPAEAAQRDPHDRSIMGGMIERGGGGMIDRSCPLSQSEIAAKLDTARVETSVFESKKEASNNTLKISSKNQHQTSELEATKTALSQLEKSDDDPVLGKTLFQELMRLGMKNRMARKLLKSHDHGLVGRILERVALRSDLKNPAGYIVCELEDGGYEAESLETSMAGSSGVSREKTGASRSGASQGLGLSAGSVSLSALETKAENDRLETESLAKEARYLEEFKTLRGRFQGLTEALRSQLRTFWNEYLEKTLPSTRRKKAMMQDPTFQRMAFKQVTERFFALVDGGLAPERALKQLAV